MMNSCSKECDCDNNNDENWAGAVAGTYTGGGTFCNDPVTSSSSIFTRESNNMLNLQITIQFSSGSQNSYCLDSILMSSATTFTINEIEGCSESDPATGGGIFSGNSVNYSMNYNPTSGSPGCSIAINGTK